jgi:hypothetical protein
MALARFKSPQALCGLKLSEPERGKHVSKGFTILHEFGILAIDASQKNCLPPFLAPEPCMAQTRMGWIGQGPTSTWIKGVDTVPSAMVTKY